MQLELALLEQPVVPDEGSKGPWDQIDPQTQIAALLLLSRLIAQKLVASQPGRAAMSEAVRITANHLARMATVYPRQSSPAQVEHNCASTDR
jgi:hypothetical protein